MNFSPQQEQALKAVDQWLRGSDQVFKLFGYAGTGKTTLARHLGADYYAAFTGKAASVLRNKGCPATTIHQLIYLPRQKSAAKLDELTQQLKSRPDDVELAQRVDAERQNLKKPHFILNLDSPLREARLLVIDECSMVNRQIGGDLLGFGCRVLVLGDPAQLPPVRGGGYFTEGTPNAMLTEIHRQARGNPILDLATIVRKTKRLPERHGLIRRSLDSDTVMRVQQLIVGRNKTRRAVNRRIRQLHGATHPMPQIGEKVVCLRNNHQIGILNGATYKVLESNDGVLGVSLLLAEEGTNEEYQVECHREPFLGEEVVDDWTALDRELFDFGYALTCHKSQGSQWPTVGVMDESAAFPGSRARWLYTAITRASEHLWVAVKE